MSIARLFHYLSCCMLGSTFAATAAGKAGAEDPDEIFAAYDLVVLDLAKTVREVREIGALTLLLDGRPVSFELEPYSVRSVDYAIYASDAAIPAPDSATYRAFVEGGGEARLLITEDRVSGLIDAEDDWYFVEPLARFRKHAPVGAVIIYRQRDILPDARAAFGLAPRFDMLEHHHGHEDVALSAQVKTTTPRTLEVATETDLLFTNANGGTVKGVSQVVEGIVNELDYLFDVNLAITVRLTAQVIAIGPGGDPYDATPYGHGPMRQGAFGSTGSGDGPCVPATGNGLWEQFRSYWNTHRGGIRRDVAVLFTGRDLKLCATVADPQERELFGTAGQVGTVCAFPGRSYVVMEQYSLNSGGLMAHEVGHSVGARHDPTTRCPGNPGDWIMCGTVRANSTMFSPASRNQVSSHLGNHGACVEPPRIELQVAAGDTYHFAAPTPPNVGRVEQLTIHNRSQGTPLRILNPGSLVGGACFQQTSLPASLILPGQSSTFGVRLLCASSGFKFGSVSVASDDPGTPSYQILLRGQVKSGPVHGIGLQASYMPSYGAGRTTFTAYDSHPGTQLSFYFDPNKGIFEGRPGGVCFNGVENPGYLKLRLIGASIHGCRFQASWDAQEIVCNQSVVNALNAGTEFVINTDDMLSEPGACKLQQPLQPHVRLGEDHHFRVTFERDGGEYRRQVNIRQNSAVSYTPVAQDTWINEALPAENYGAQTMLMASNASGSRRHAIVYAGSVVMGTFRSATLQLNIGSAGWGGARVYELHHPFLSGLCNENTLTWNNVQGCFDGESFVVATSMALAHSALVLDVTPAIAPQGGLHAFRISTLDTALNRWFHSSESPNNIPYLVTTSSP